MWTAVSGFLGGISPRVWKWLAIVVAVISLIWLLNHAVTSYGDRREQMGVDREKAAWEEADRKVQIKVAMAQTEATASAVKREARHELEVAEERKKIDEAVTEGRSPLDVLFSD